MIDVHSPPSPSPPIPHPPHPIPNSAKIQPYKGQFSGFPCCNATLFVHFAEKEENTMISHSRILPLMPTWVLARPEPHLPSATKMAALSPGSPEVRMVHHQDSNKKPFVALIISSVLVCAILLSLFSFCIYRRRNSKTGAAKGQQGQEPGKGISLGPVLGRFSSLRMAGRKGSVAFIEYQLLAAATNDFQENNVLGDGGVGRLFKARFNDNLLAAVKRLDGGRNAGREFENEVDLLSKIQHQNIVSLLGYSIHGQKRFLVYEMTHNGSLEYQLHGPYNGSTLNWNLRLKIALDVARGLEFLHECCHPPVIHRDLKSSNILLDSNFNAKLSDFGVAIACGNHSRDNIKLLGTLGYAAPEYLLDGKLTDKSDVYAFGVVLLELLMGRKPVEETESAQCHSLVTWAMPHLTDRSKLPNIVDPVIRNTMDLKHLYQVAAVAVLCVQSEPSYRPLITDVLHSFIPLVPSELGGLLRVPGTLSTGSS